MDRQRLGSVAVQGAVGDFEMTKRQYKKCFKKFSRIVAGDYTPPSCTWRQRDFLFEQMDRAVTRINARKAARQGEEWQKNLSRECG
jgi:hypothetical protein